MTSLGQVVYYFVTRLTMITDFLQTVLNKTNTGCYQQVATEQLAASLLASTLLPKSCRLKPVSHFNYVETHRRMFFCVKVVSSLSLKKQRNMLYASLRHDG